MPNGWIFNPPPGWPPAPPGFVPPPGWRPDPSWPPAPEDWAFWIPDPRGTQEQAIGPFPQPDKPSWRESSARRKAERDASKAARQAAKTQAKREQSQRRALAVAQAEHQRREQARIAEHTQVAGLARIVRAIASGSWSATFGLMLKPGESALWGGAGQLVEPRTTRGHYEGRSQGVSLHITKGVHYRVGASQGTYVPGTDQQTTIDNGEIVVTTTRVVFRGSRMTREWSYSKMINVPYTTDRALLMPVSNRQKISGLTGYDEDFTVYLIAALAIHDRGAADVAAELEAEAARLAVAEPVPQIAAAE